MDLALELSAMRRLAGALTAPADADDLVQDTVLAALRRPPEADRPVRPWLLTVLRNRHVSQRRAQYREDARASATPAVESQPSLEHVQLLRELLDEIAVLPADVRTILALRYWEGLSAEECALRLGRPASTVRTQVQRALQQLRARLDRRRGGRQAWLPLLAPFAPPPRGATTTLLGSKSLGLGAVAAATILWLGAALPNGCSAHVDGAELAASPVEGERPGEAKAAERSRPAKRPRPGPTAELAALLVPSPSDDDAERPDYRAAVVGQNGGEHPQMAVTMAIGAAWNQMLPCRVGSGPGSARITTTIRFDPDGSTSFERVDFERVKHLAGDELDCVRQVMLARELEVKKVDTSMLGFGDDVSLEYWITADFTIDEGKIEVEGLYEQPMTSLYTDDKDDSGLREAVTRCGRGPLEVELRFDPSTGALADARPLGAHADSKQGRCVAKAILARVRPGRRFEPTVPEDALIRCTFGLEEPAVGYLCTQVGPEPRWHPHPVP